MSFTTALLDSGQICLELSPQQQEQAWQQSQAFATPSSRWRAYLHGLALAALLPWLGEEGLAVRANPQAMNYQWELFDGIPLQVGTERRSLVLLPAEQLDLDDWTIPQEWIDSPALLADYLVAVQVDPDGLAVRLVGFSTQARVKAQARLDCGDRTYSLPQSSWIADLALLAPAMTLVPTEAPCGDRHSIAELLPLSVEAADGLIERLGNPARLQPRLEVPFERWAALVAHGGWQQRLAEQRRGQPRQRSIADWLRAGLSSLGLEEGWGYFTASTQPSLGPALAGVRSLSAAPAEAPQAPSQGICRRLTLEGQACLLSFVCLDEARNTWRISLSRVDGGPLSPGWALRIFSENLQDFAGNEDRAEGAQALLYLDLQLASGEGIVWETTPHAEGYIPEILRF